jgi:hypothetical protein
VRIPHSRTARFALAALLWTTTTFAAAAGELPSWPHEQQDVLRQVEEELLVVQRRMFKARQKHDVAALETDEVRFRELQEQRRQLIELTRDQLPSE